MPTGLLQPLASPGNVLIAAAEPECAHPATCRTVSPSRTLAPSCTEGESEWQLPPPHPAQCCALQILVLLPLRSDKINGQAPLPKRRYREHMAALTSFATKRLASIGRRLQRHHRAALFLIVSVAVIGLSSFCSQYVWRENGLRSLQAVNEPRIELIASAV